MYFRRVFYNEAFSEVQISHHAFAFPKTTNFPEIVNGVETLLELMKNADPPHEPPMKKMITSPTANATQTMSFKLELKQCEVGCILQDKLVDCVANMKANAAAYLKSLELPGLGSDELLCVIAMYCNNLEVLNVQGSREAVTDRGFARYVKEASPEAKSKLKQLDVSRCMLTQVTLVHLQQLTGKYLTSFVISRKINLHKNSNFFFLVKIPWLSKIK